MKVNVSCLMIGMPIIMPVVYFGGLELLLEGRVLAKGAFLTLFADAFCVFSLFSYIFMKHKLSLMQVGKVESLQKWMLSILIVSLVLSTLLFYPTIDSMISAGVFVISLVSFLNFILLLKEMGGRVGKVSMQGPDDYHTDRNASQSLVNPSNGLPMIGGVSGMDVQGNSWGTNDSESSSSYDSNRGY